MRELPSNEPSSPLPLSQRTQTCSKPAPSDVEGDGNVPPLDALLSHKSSSSAVTDQNSRMHENGSQTRPQHDSDWNESHRQSMSDDDKRMEEGRGNNCPAQTNSQQSRALETVPYVHAQVNHRHQPAADHFVKVPAPHPTAAHHPHPSAWHVHPSHHHHAQIHHQHHHRGQHPAAQPPQPTYVFSLHPNMVTPVAHVPIGAAHFAQLPPSIWSPLPAHPHIHTHPHVHGSVQTHTYAQPVGQAISVQVQPLHHAHFAHYAHARPQNAALPHALPHIHHQQRNHDEHTEFSALNHHPAAVQHRPGIPSAMYKAGSTSVPVAMVPTQSALYSAYARQTSASEVDGNTEKRPRSPKYSKDDPMESETAVRATEPNGTNERVLSQNVKDGNESSPSDTANGYHRDIRKDSPSCDDRDRAQKVLSSPKSSKDEPVAQQPLQAVPRKPRKPYTITKNRENWTPEEHSRFLTALQLYDRDWKRIEQYIGTKTVLQIRSHAQKYFGKVAKYKTGEYVPPARPKRRASMPYPRSRGMIHSKLLQGTDSRDDENRLPTTGSDNGAGSSDNGNMSGNISSTAGASSDDNAIRPLRPSEAQTARQRSVDVLSAPAPTLSDNCRYSSENMLEDKNSRMNDQQQLSARKSTAKILNAANDSRIALEPKELPAQDAVRPCYTIPPPTTHFAAGFVRGNAIVHNVGRSQYSSHDFRGPVASWRGHRLAVSLQHEKSSADPSTLRKPQGSHNSSTDSDQGRSEVRKEGNISTEHVQERVQSPQRKFLGKPATKASSHRASVAYSSSCKDAADKAEGSHGRGTDPHAPLMVLSNCVDMVDRRSTQEGQPAAGWAAAAAARRAHRARVIRNRKDEGSLQISNYESKSAEKVSGTGSPGSDLNRSTNGSPADIEVDDASQTREPNGSNNGQSDSPSIEVPSDENARAKSLAGLLSACRKDETLVPISQDSSSLGGRTDTGSGSDEAIAGFSGSDRPSLNDLGTVTSSGEGGSRSGSRSGSMETSENGSSGDPNEDPNSSNDGSGDDVNGRSHGTRDSSPADPISSGSRENTPNESTASRNAPQIQPPLSSATVTPSPEASRANSPNDVPQVSRTWTVPSGNRNDPSNAHASIMMNDSTGPPSSPAQRSLRKRIPMPGSGANNALHTAGIHSPTIAGAARAAVAAAAAAAAASAAAAAAACASPAKKSSARTEIHSLLNGPVHEVNCLADRLVPDRKRNRSPVGQVVRSSSGLGDIEKDRYKSHSQNIICEPEKQRRKHSESGVASGATSMANMHALQSQRQLNKS